MRIARRGKTLPLVIGGFAIAAALLALAQGVAARSNVGAPVRQTAGTGHTVSVQGHGEMMVAPDMASITAGVDSHDTKAETALADNSSKMNAVISAIKAQGVPASHIQTTDLSLYYDSQHDSYVVSHQVTARIDRVDTVGAVLDAAVAAGANNSWGVSFGLKDPIAAKAQALKAAITDARARADSLASALGVTITGVGSVEESTVNYQPIPYAAASTARAPSAVTPVQPGQLSVTADVGVVYTFG
ncbi:MAG: SIMPL domain-containing protein [Chloroflexota bacterium]